ncbi:MAG: TonB-dependent receptor [Candidatus Azobacteroides sp.]|nr:TonB-dependent receptor [Candidatus Azobacteroides sp.]
MPVQIKLRLFLITGGFFFCFSSFSQKDNIKQISSESLKDTISLREVVVSGKKPDENVSSVNMGVEKLSMSAIKKMPALMGEVDIIKAIQLLPGVQATSEGSSGFSVRGGSPDQNLILLDNTTVYNPSHMMGFFSVFNNDVISGLELYKGDIPIKHGGRLSSLLDVQTKENMPDRFSGSGGLGLISSRLMLEGPIGENTSWLISGRRSYADLFLKLSSDEAINSAILYFYDLNAKISHKFSSRDRLSLNAYYGKDAFGAKPGDFTYGNGASSLTWSHIFSDKLYGKFSLNATNYDYGMATNIEGAKLRWDASMFDLMLRADFSQQLNNTFNLNYGVTSTWHRINPGLVVSPMMVKDYNMENTYALESSIYLSNEQKITDALIVKYGLRGTIFQNIGPGTVYNYGDDHKVQDSVVYNSRQIYYTHKALEPRVGLVYKLNPNSSVKANYAHNVQFMQLANNSASGSPLDVWFSASPNIKPQQVDMFSVGYFRNFKDNMFETSAEIYYKDLKNVIDFADHANLMLNRHLEGEIRTGTGKAYGLELMVRKNTGRLTGFTNYTLSRSERTIPEINNGKTYLAPYDKTHVFNIVMNYEISPKFNVSGNWVFATGNPTTYPTGGMDIEGERFPIYSGRNEYRMPNYDRLDLSLNYIPNPNSKKRWKSEWNVSLYNAYGRKNAWIISYNQEDGKPPVAQMTYLFGIVPSITYNFKF